jgi:hypothetical protein
MHPSHLHGLVLHYVLVAWCDPVAAISGSCVLLLLPSCADVADEKHALEAIVINSILVHEAASEQRDAIAVFSGPIHHTGVKPAWIEQAP